MSTEGKTVEEIERENRARFDSLLADVMTAERLAQIVDALTTRVLRGDGEAFDPLHAITTAEIIRRVKTIEERLDDDEGNRFLRGERP